jgi:hypothetical protein
MDYLGLRFSYRDTFVRFSSVVTALVVCYFTLGIVFAAGEVLTCFIKLRDSMSAFVALGARMRFLGGRLARGLVCSCPKEVFA